MPSKTTMTLTNRKRPPNFILSPNTAEYDHACAKYSIHKRQKSCLVRIPATSSSPPPFEMLDKDVVTLILTFLDDKDVATARLLNKFTLSSTPPSWTFVKRCGHLSFYQVCHTLNLDEVEGEVVDAGEVDFWRGRVGRHRFDALMRSQAVHTGNYAALVRFNAADDLADREAHRDYVSALASEGKAADEYVPPRMYVSPLNLCAFVRNAATPLQFFEEEFASFTLESETRNEFQLLFDVSLSCLFAAIDAGREDAMIDFFSDLAVEIVSDERKHSNALCSADNPAMFMSKCIAATSLRCSLSGKRAISRILLAHRDFVVCRAGKHASDDDDDDDDDDEDDDSISDKIDKVLAAKRREEIIQKMHWERGLSYIFSDFFRKTPSDVKQLDFLVSILASLHRSIDMRDIFYSQKMGLLENPDFAKRLFQNYGWDDIDVDEFFETRCPLCLINLASKTDEFATILETLPSSMLTRKTACVSRETFLRTPANLRPTRILAETLFYAPASHLRGALRTIPLSFRSRSSALQFNAFALALLRLACSEKYDYVIGRCTVEEKARLQAAMLDFLKKAFLASACCNEDIDVEKRSAFVIRFLEETGLGKWDPLWAAHAANGGYDTFLCWAIEQQLHISDVTKKKISSSESLPNSYVMLLKRGYPLPTYLPCPKSGSEFARVKAMAEAGALHHLLKVNRISLYFPELIDIIEKKGPFRLGV